MKILNTPYLRLDLDIMKKNIKTKISKNFFM